MAINIQKIQFARKLIRKAFREYRWRFVLIFVLGILSGIFGGVGIGAIIPLFSLMSDQIVSAEIDTISRFVEQFFAFFHIPFTLPFLVTFIAILFVFKGVIHFFTKFINDKTAAEFERKMRGELFNKVLQSKWSYLLNQKVGHMERILMNDVQISSRIFVHFSTLILFVTTFAVYALVAFSISTPVTLLTMALGGVLFFIFRPLMYKTRLISRELADNEKIVTHHLSESTIGIKIIKTTSSEDKVAKRGFKYFELLERARVKTSLYIHSVGSVYEPIGFIFVAILFIFYYQSASFNIIAFGAVVYLIQKMFSFIQAAQGSVHRINEMAPYLQTVLEYRSMAMGNQEELSGLTRFKFSDRINLDNIKFSYDKEKNILSGVSFSIKRGEMVGLVGSSGAGKTTIADLLLRLFTPDSGTISLDGININDINLMGWRKNIGYVSQEVFLLNDTIKNNIRFYDGSILDKDIINAAKAANIYSFIKKLSHGFETNIGERGIKLSGGQRQRIALARTLARNPQILILDEATSALDSQSEIAIQKAIENLRGKVTVLAIAHRLSTVINSDKLVILEKGKVAEEGPPKKLLKDKDSHFYRLYNIRQ